MFVDTVGSHGELLNLKAVRGNNIGPFVVTWTDDEGVPVDITGAQCFVVVQALRARSNCKWLVKLREQLLRQWLVRL